MARLLWGLIDSLEQAESRQHTPKVAFVAKPQAYKASSGKSVAAEDTDLLVRALSMGQLASRHDGNGCGCDCFCCKCSWNS